MYFELSDDGILFVGTGYRIYTPWENIAGLAWTQLSGAFPSFIQLKERAVVGEISLEEGRLSRRAVAEKRRWWVGNWQLKADAQYTQYIRTPAILLRRKERDDGSIDQFQKRRDALLIAILPSLLFALLLLPLLFVQPGVVSDILTFFLMVNLICTCPNLYVFCWLLKKPGDTLFYTKSMKTLLAFEPVRDSG